MNCAKNKKNKQKILVIAAIVVFLVFFLIANIYVSFNHLTVEKKAERFGLEEPYIFKNTE
jgi:flagellar basal body-associated protein FliL